MIGWWPGDGNTDDIVGGRNAVLLDNAATGPGFVGDAFLLDGAGDFVEVSNNPALEVGSGDFTVDFWVLFNTTAGEQILVEKYVEDFSGNAPGWSFAKLSNNALVVAPNSPQTPPLSLQPNTWYHFAARRSSGNITIFVDGKKMASGPLGSGGNANTDSSLKFGHRGSPSDTPGSSDNRGFFLNGRIDEVELFVGRALSDAEILAIYDARGEGKCKIQVDYNGQTNCSALDSGFDKTTAALDSPWLSVAVGEMTKVAKAEITPRENATDVTFKSKDTGRATVKPDTATASPQVLEVTGVAQGETPGLIEARIQDRDPVVKALSVAVYEKKTLTVAVFVIKPKKRPGHPRRGCPKPNPGTFQARLQTGLNNIWDQAAVQFTVKKFVKKTVDFDVDEEDCQLDASTSSLELGPELKALTDAVRDLTAGINIYYIHDIKGLIDTGVTLPDNLIFIQDGHSLSTETLTAHEIGHVLGLDDVNDETRLMHFEGSAAGNNCFLNKPEWDTSNATAERF